MKYILLYITLSLYAAICSAQQFPDRHSTSYTDAWLSCTPSINPNTDRGEGHWINYDLGATYVMNTITLWNYNDPLNLDNGVQELAIDVSSDGITWVEVGTTSVDVSEGSAFYQGENIIDLGGVAADYLLITVLSNHGGSCSGFSEVKISSAAVLPIEMRKQKAICVEDDDAVLIVWQTVGEVGNDYFTIQKSDNTKDWIDITELSAKGRDGQGAEYSYLDRDTSGKYYYRINNTDLDGQRQYFDVMSANCDDSKTISMSVANPFSESLVITYYPLATGGDIISTIESLDGKTIYHNITKHQINTVTIPSSEWATGTYIITIQQGPQRITQKVVKI